MGFSSYASGASAAASFPSTHPPPPWPVGDWPCNLLSLAQSHSEIWGVKEIDKCWKVCVIFCSSTGKKIFWGTISPEVE